MNDGSWRENWNEKQIKWIEFLARNKTTKDGRKCSVDTFANAIDINQNTLYEWKRIKGFANALFEASLEELAPMLPSLNSAIVGKASGMKQFSKADTQAYLAVMRQYSLLKSDKIDHTTNGKDLPTPIYGGSSNATE